MEYRPFRIAETPAFFHIMDALGMKVLTVCKDGTGTDKEIRERAGRVVDVMNRSALFPVA